VSRHKHKYTATYRVRGVLFNRQHYFRPHDREGDQRADDEKEQSHVTAHVHVPQVFEQVEQLARPDADKSE
jgi:hypothetical protein